ncbi:MAG TPA: DUF4336 domain-containing protein [Marinagarivorans sp.]
MKKTCTHFGRYDLYHPINQLKPVAHNIWLVDSETINFKGVPFPTRMTVIRLQTGGLFVHSPTDLTASLRSEIDKLGPVEHLVSPNRIHYCWIGQWGEAYPNAKKWASPDVQSAVEPLAWQFDCELSTASCPPWDDEISQLHVCGSRFLEEYVFFHKSSRTLIFADLIENFERNRIHPWWLKYLFMCAGNADPDGKLPLDLRLSYFGRHDQLSKAVNTMIAWQPERIIIAHGRWYRENAVDELRRAFRWVKGVT